MQKSVGGEEKAPGGDSMALSEKPQCEHWHSRWVLPARKDHSRLRFGKGKCE